jgi:quercetin dioxygenase-like cupin family protein
MGSMKPTRQTKGGEVRVVDSSTFNVSKTIAAALVTVHPGGMREMHWHPNADEWQYWIKGKGRMTVFNTGPNAVTMDFNPGDIGYVKRNYGHYLENVGDTDVDGPRSVPEFVLCRYFPVRLVGAHAAGDGRPAPQCRRGDDRKIPQRQAGSHAPVIGPPALVYVRVRQYGRRAAGRFVKRRGEPACFPTLP